VLYASCVYACVICVGRIIPQALCSRYSLAIGAHLSGYILHQSPPPLNQQ
jgi:hypothetical protein